VGHPRRGTASGDATSEPERPIQDMPVKEEERAQGLFLSRGGDLVPLCKVLQECEHVLFVEDGWMSQSMEADEAHYPADVSLLGSQAIVTQA